MLLAWLVRSSWKALVVALIASLISGACGTGILWVIHSAASARELPAQPGVVFGALCAGLLLSRIVAQLTLVRLTQDTLLAMRQTLARRIAATPLQALEHMGHHRLLAALSDDVVAISAAMPGIATAASNTAIIVGTLVYLALLSPLLFLGTAAAMTIGVASHRAVVRVALRSLRSSREDQNVLFERFKSLLEGVKELKLHAGRRASFLEGDLDPAARSFRDHFVRGMGLYAVAVSWGELLFLIAVGVVALAAPPGLSQATVSGFVLAILYLSGPLQALLGWLPTLGRAQVAVATLHRLGLELDRAVSPDDDRPPAGGLGAAWRTLELRGVSYRYAAEDDAFALGPIDLAVSRGEVVFVVGSNGGGKTTLAKLVTGLYVPSRGELRLDGAPIDDASREAYRQLFSAIFCDSHLFERLHGLDATGAGRDYLKLLELDRVVSAEGGAFSTIRLSQGQRRRLLLLVALLEDRPICVFDEWAADQDPRFRRVFYERIVPELKACGKTVLAITHDERYWHVADRVAEMTEGRLVERRVPVAPAAHRSD
jgi:putative ATP-binding cassette transporter